MKNLLLLISISLIVKSAISQSENRKVLFIGIDGCRWDAIEAADCPALDGLLPNAIMSSNALTEYQTWSGTGWSNMLTGVWHTQHGVIDNSFSGANFTEHPDFISRIEDSNSDLNTTAIVHWGPLCTNIIQNIDNEIIVGTDLEVKNSAVDELTSSDPDVLFIAFDDVDHAGHSYGFSPTISNYIDAIETTDGYIAEVIAALENRPNFSSEDWLIIVTTDHGGTLDGHGGGTLEERSIFTVYNNPNFTQQIIERGELSATSTFNEAHFNAGSFAQPINQAPFEFGATQDFSIEFWVKATSFVSDPALIGNKNWNSGLNPGFVISAQASEFWKVNFGDGTNRIDIQGGYLEPNVWHHIAVSCDRDGLVTAYQDGAVVGFEWMENVGDLNSGFPLIINQDGTTTYGYDFDGSFKDIRIWNAAITEDEIVEWALNPISNAHPNWDNLLAHWTCEDGSGNTLTDSSDNENDCAVNGAIDWTNATSNFTMYDYRETPREPDNAATALEWMCVSIEESWNLDGQSWVESCSTISVENLEINAGFSISPNPATSIITINLETASKGTTNASLFDTQGKMVKRISFKTGQTSVQMSIDDLETGVYFLKLMNDFKQQTAKVVVN